MSAHACVLRIACACGYIDIYISLSVCASPGRRCPPARLPHPVAAAFLSVCSLMSRHSRANRGDRQAELVVKESAAAGTSDKMLPVPPG